VWLDWVKAVAKTDSQTCNASDREIPTLHSLFHWLTTVNVRQKRETEDFLSQQFFISSRFAAIPKQVVGTLFGRGMNLNRKDC
jgi:hypothetical protein